MIIKRIVSENFLKYRRLDINKVPAKGRIAVSGDNEAGKTAIGETICFALFGRTFSLGPRDIHRAARWGEFSAKALLEFTGRDGQTYAVTRLIDNNGRHSARLHRAGEASPISEELDEVNLMIEEVVGFSFKSYADSFYLAQREMEVPHGKSDTVKALIGVDRLEELARRLQRESMQHGEKAALVEAEILECRESIAEVNLDRGHLGRLEIRRDQELEQASLNETRAAELQKKAENIGHAARTFAKASEMFIRSSPSHTFSEWQEKNKEIHVGLTVATKATKQVSGTVDDSNFKEAGATVVAFENGLSEFDKVRDLAQLYRHQLQFMLDEQHEEAGAVCTVPPCALEQGGPNQKKFAEQRSLTLAKLDDTRRRRKPSIVLAIFLAEVAMLGWFAWSTLLAWPGSAFAGWIEAALRMNSAARQGVCLVTGLLAGMAAVYFFSRWRQAGRRAQQLELEIENLESAVRAAKDEIEIIGTLDGAPMADALLSMETLRNPLIKGAVTAFVDGAGAVFVKPDAMDQKLDHLRRHSVDGIQSLKRAKDRLLHEVEALKADALVRHETVTAIEKDIECERLRWEEVERLERELDGMRGRLDRVKEEGEVCEIACELVDETARRIYGRFRPELRRFVGRILPELTAGRYEHLELDDDLNVRVYCRSKNDFVGLDEISNGTHRQLMLCVRLALAQALIVSSGSKEQYILFDEPFVFFDQSRMNRAIDILGKISPQITQVWVVAQTFQEIEGIDMVIECPHGSDRLVIAGKRRQKSPVESKRTNGVARPVTLPHVAAESTTSIHPLEMSPPPERQTESSDSGALEEVTNRREADGGREVQPETSNGGSTESKPRTGQVQKPKRIPKRQVKRHAKTGGKSKATSARQRRQKERRQRRRRSHQISLRAVNSNRKRRPRFRSKSRTRA